MTTFTNDPVVSKTTSKNAISITGESDKNEGVRGISHNAHGGVVGINDWTPKKPGAGGNGGWFESSRGEGVRGWAKSPHHGGVVGVNTAGGIGVFGESDSNTGVVGKGSSGNGGWFESGQGEGVRGVANNLNHGGVVGVNTAKGIAVFGTSNGEGVHGETTANTFVAGVTGIAINQDGIGPGVLGLTNGSGPGVVGKAIRDAGVIGFHGDPRLQETTVANDGGKAGVFGASDIGAGVLGYSRDPGSPAIFAFGGFRAIALGKPLAGLFDGNVQINGNLQVAGDILLPGADFAENFDIADSEIAVPGTVMVIADDGSLHPCAEPYDKKVAGVISGAGAFKPGVVLDGRESENPRAPIALVGKVYCKVDADIAPIRIGDLLTTSSTPGHAMRAEDLLKAFGSVIGKALRSLESGQGLVPVLIALQ